MTEPMRRYEATELRDHALAQDVHRVVEHLNSLLSEAYSKGLSIVVDTRVVARVGERPDVQLVVLNVAMARPL
jgi:hypothetical protein